MPFETAAAATRRIAVIGAGISGMGAAHALAASHRVTLFEAEPRLGGHARTVFAGRRGDQPVDTGFIVFNRVNYPHLVELFDRLGVPVTESNMSFGASIDGGRLEYGLASIGTIFAQRRNLANPRFLGMVRDILRFNARAASTTRDRTETIAGLIDRLRLGAWFRDYYLLPLSGAIWSTPTRKILDFPAEAMVRFLENHALLNYSRKHQWYTVIGGSVAYVSRLEAALRNQGAEIRLSAPVAAVRRLAAGVEVRARGGAWEQFDEVVFACHTDQALAALADASDAERRLLGAIRYQPNHAVLHADASLMPRRRQVWSSWNYAEPAGRPGDRIDLTYWMNSLQPIPQDDPLFVTLNATRPIREELIYDEVTFAHPLYDVPALMAQEAIRALNGSRNTWFCGAWMRNGFHEDGLASGLEVARAIAAAAASRARAAA
ncbi:MAG: FAD-dependent oxidoreductase [Rhodobacteraceae bacterium]|nr:FAD-dependent oxidoreductase [Paracoccaceae bacterium]